MYILFKEHSSISVSHFEPVKPVRHIHPCTGSHCKELIQSHAKLQSLPYWLLGQPLISWIFFYFFFTIFILLYNLPLLIQVLLYSSRICPMGQEQKYDPTVSLQLWEQPLVLVSHSFTFKHVLLSALFNSKPLLHLQIAFPFPSRVHICSQFLVVHAAILAFGSSILKINSNEQTII